MLSQATAGPSADDDSYKGMNNYVDHKKGFRREHTIGAEKGSGMHGPLRASAHIRTTIRFDYQPDICKVKVCCIQVSQHVFCSNIVLSTLSSIYSSTANQHAVWGRTTRRPATAATEMPANLSMIALTTNQAGSLRG